MVQYRVMHRIYRVSLCRSVISTGFPKSIMTEQDCIAGFVKREPVADFGVGISADESVADLGVVWWLYRLTVVVAHYHTLRQDTAVGVVGKR